MNGALAVVTGGAGGIGRAVTAALAEDGCRVIAVDIRGGGAGPGAHGEVVADVGDPDAVAGLFRRIEETYGVPDVLVNNAGVYEARDFLDYDAESYRRVFDSNATSAFFCTQAFARLLIAAGRPGSVVNVASISGQSGSPDAAYGASKGAVITLTRGLGRSLAAHGIRVNAVAPGVIDTPMAARIPRERRADYAARVPVGRLGEAGEVAAAVRFLAGPGAGYVTATVLDVNGGLG
ncbi:SDR family oxidoreductase [Streptomyces sp. MUM 203J]|nr:SDR family oxidoreductase [Streptomyces sp. MUM 203J]